MARFQKGNSGRPRGSVNKFRKAIHEAVTEKDIQDVIAKLIQKAKLGNMQATKLVLEYTAGKPADHITIEQEHQRIQPVVIKTISSEDVALINRRLEDEY